MGLPEQQPGVVYLISRTVLDHVDRSDLAVPTDLVRDENGTVTGAGAMEMVRHATDSIDQ
ncbi:MAG: hypothetical protein JST64_13855 [Actinobacteria bacterium]|nr:hypothetical protein [Actinomycetota bacterium]